MVFATEQKKELIDQYKQHETDTGSPEVQVGLLTHRIQVPDGAFKSAQERSPFPSGIVDFGGSSSASAQLC